LVEDFFNSFDKKKYFLSLSITSVAFESLLPCLIASLDLMNPSPMVFFLEFYDRK
jgi:hypothetical protein